VKLSGSEQNAPVDLYALPPEEFIAARDAAAKGDKSLKALQKPTLSAWVVNTLVRREAGLLGQLLSLGAELGQAQEQGDATALRELGAQRRQLVQAVTQTAVDLAGRDVTAAVRTEVEATLDAALADPASAEAVQTGRLVRALSFAGFGGVDLDGAVADLPTVSTRTRRKSAPPQHSARETPTIRVQQLEAAALQAQGELDDAVRRAEAAAAGLRDLQSDLARATEHDQQAAATVERARRALESAQVAAADTQGRRTRVKKATDEAERKLKGATAAIEAAQGKADAARKALDDARRS